MFTYLALGDSYTIGESILLKENFPYQTVQLLRKQGLRFSAPEIIARTGWTSGELLLAMQDYNFLPNYDLISLLIGVNNQYRGLAIEVFEREFALLLNKALGLAGNDKTKVAVISIPDWGVTPFAEGRDRQTIALEVDDYNAACERLSAKTGVHFIDITRATRKAKDDNLLLSADGLHPSPKLYAQWSQSLADWVSRSMRR